MIGARRRRAHASRRGRGFTLVEVLVALLIMALLATLAWQGLAGIVRGSDGSRDAIDRTARLATVLTQWEQDLQALYDTGVVPAISFDGQTLRLTRRGEGGVIVVAWAVRGGLWQRWAAPAVARNADLQENWLRSQQLLGNEAGQLTLVAGASQWQIYFSRGGQWSNAQSTGDLAPTAPTIVVEAATPATSASSAAQAASAAAADAAASAVSASGAMAAAVATMRAVLPEGVRLVITLDAQPLTRDIALGPTG